MIKIHNLIAGYYGDKVTPTISGYIKKGSILIVVGDNGIGKSTFLKTLVGLLPPTSGKLEFEENKKPKIISYLPQIKNMNRYFPATVFDVVSMGCWPRVSFFKKLNSYQKYLIWKSLAEVKLLNLSNQMISNLSGGQFQRMLFARILVQNASFIVLDEPFQGLSKEICKIFIHSIKRLCKSGSAVVLALHDTQYLTKYFTCDILLLRKFDSIWKLNK